MGEKEDAAPAGPMRNIYALGVVSLLTDVSTEMAYPLMPALIASLGGGAAALGLVEGVAEATASLMKAVSGWVSDKWGKRKTPIFWGYGVSAFGKPLLGLAGSWPLVLCIRFLDRVGKGVRTAPRDALIADSTSKDKMGFAFGLHRAMDTAGAVLGPLAAYLLLHLLGWKLNWIFFAATVPAMLGLLVIAAAVKEVPPPRREGAVFKFSFKELNPAFKRFVIVSGVFSLANFPTAFLILRLNELGWGPDRSTLVYLLANLVYSLMALPAGRLSDRVGRRRMLIAAYLLFAAAFGLFALADRVWGVIALFMVYAVFQAIYETNHRAFCADLEPSERRASSYGVLHTAIGLAALPAGAVAGGLWKLFGSQAAFGLSAAIGLVAAALFIILIPKAMCPLPKAKVVSSQ